MEGIPDELYETGTESELRQAGVVHVLFEKTSPAFALTAGPKTSLSSRRWQMNLAKSERSHKRGIQAKRKLACWNDAYLLKLPQAGLPQNQAPIRCARPGWFRGIPRILFLR
jgi:hypothetical protein